MGTVAQSHYMSHWGLLKAVVGAVAQEFCRGLQICGCLGARDYRQRNIMGYPRPRA